jgi:hypothetical protein
MKKIINLSLLVSLSCVTLYAQDDTNQRDRIPSVKKAIGRVADTKDKEIDIVDGFVHMFKDGKVTGQVRTMYSRVYNDGTDDIYATAIGGFLKYELAQYKGFNAGVSFHTTHDLEFASGDNNKRNENLSSSKGNYTQLTNAYINYKYEDLNIRIGRQTLDTPLADSDDIRMVENTFMAYTAAYATNGFSLMLGHLVSWQGSDAGLDEGWIKTSKDGVNFIGAGYENDFIQTSLWYYNINGQRADEMANNTLYADLIGKYDINKNISLHAGVQYLTQDELDNSGVESDIYGAMAELVVYGLGLNIAYNKSLKKDNKQSFSGFGGGTLFTNMDSMILDTITADRDADVVVSGISYEIGDFNFLYAYGNFKGDVNSLGDKEHIVEQDIGLNYSHNENFNISALYNRNNDKLNSGSNDGNWDNFRVLMSYNF